MAGQFFGIMNVVSSDNEWLSQPINSAGNCFEAPKISPELTQIFAIDLFGLYILFSHFRPRDATRGNSFFQMSSYARANLRITNEKTKGKFP